MLFGSGDSSIVTFSVAGVAVGVELCGKSSWGLAMRVSIVPYDVLCSACETSPPDAVFPLLTLTKSS